MKTTTKEKYLKLIESLYSDIEKQKVLDKNVKSMKEQIKAIMDKDSTCDFGEYMALLNDVARDNCDYKQAVNDGIDLSQYIKKVKYQTLKIVKK